MIQRKQSLFLLGSFIISGLLIYLPIFEMGANNADPAPARTFYLSVNALLLILNGGIGVLSFVAIFLFKRRNIQLRFTNLGILLTCILIGLLFFLSDTMSSGLNEKVHYLYGSYLPLIQLMLIFLAGRFIKHDEELVRSSDRLR